MTDADVQAGKQLLQEDFIQANPECATAALHTCVKVSS